MGDTFAFGLPESTRSLLYFVVLSSPVVLAVVAVNLMPDDKQTKPVIVVARVIITITAIPPALIISSAEF